MLIELAQAATPDNGNSDVITIVYVLTSISLIIGFIVGTYKYVQRQKKKWLDEGVTRQVQAQATADNTAMMMKNTEAVSKLSSEFGKFAATVRADLNGLGNKVNGLGSRLDKLEHWKQDQVK